MAIGAEPLKYAHRCNRDKNTGSGSCGNQQPDGDDDQQETENDAQSLAMMWLHKIGLQRRRSQNDGDMDQRGREYIDRRKRQKGRGHRPIRKEIG